MKKLIKSILFFSALCSLNFLQAQKATQAQWSGVPCEDCVNPQSNEKGGNKSVQNRNG